jgi:hypothetical protein
MKSSQQRQQRQRRQQSPASAVGGVACALARSLAQISTTANNTQQKLVTLLQIVKRKKQP